MTHILCRKTHSYKPDVVDRDDPDPMYITEDVSDLNFSKNTAELYSDALVWTEDFIDWLDWFNFVRSDKSSLRDEGLSYS